MCAVCELPANDWLAIDLTSVSAVRQERPIFRGNQGLEAIRSEPFDLALADSR